MDTNSMLIIVLIAVVGLLCLLTGIVLILQLRKSSNANADVSTPLQNLTQAIQDMRVQTAPLQGLTQAIQDVQVQTAPLQNLTQAIQDVRAQTSSLTADFKARADSEKQTADSIRRLETIVAGSSSKGAAGERIVDELFSKIPIEWQVQNFRIANKPVEFALRLPNNLILPIDSKWAATTLLEQYSTSTDPDEQKKLREQIEGIVIGKAKEVKKYLDPNITFPFGIAVIPDAVYALCQSVNIETSKHKVVVVSYSTFLPYILLIFQTVLSTSRTIDMEKLNAQIQAVGHSLSAIESELENRYSKAITMLDISRRELKGHIGKASNAITSIQISSNQPTNFIEGEQTDKSE